MINFLLVAELDFYSLKKILSQLNYLRWKNCRIGYYGRVNLFFFQNGHFCLFIYKDKG